MMTRKLANFAAGNLPTNAWAALPEHFSKDLLNFKSELSATKKSVDALQLELTPFQKSSFYPDFRERAGERIKSCCA
ncbi:hypothetical protein BZM27_54065 [Paraburkholderia steynii]|uniref:Uncharacterized protein n=1 Tax=Paraburkholderia steynii TaxID=1245441 RepID=A0A4R0X2R7_9BURK|nr:hypothetical protein BZM27_54065 [Paraburkholderia steynii]